MLIQVRDLVFDYPGHRVLNQVSFDVEQGEIMALVGPNGAGKTTLMRCLAALLTPLAGEILIDGIDAQTQPKQVHRRIGYLSDFFGLYDELSVGRCLQHQGAIQGLRGVDLKASVARAAELLHLTHHLNQPVSALSRGWRQRTAIAMSMVHRPKLLLLDEPASGLDPEARESLSALMVELQKDGHTIIISSHILAELDQYCTGLMILSNGEVRLHGIHDVNQHHVNMKLSYAVAGLVDILRVRPDIDHVEGNEVAVRLTLAANRDRARLLADLMAEGFPISDFYQEENRLQDVYLHEVRGRDDGIAGGDAGS